MGHADLGDRNFVLISNTILKLVVEVLSNVGDENLEVRLSQCLSKANSVTSMERRQARAAALLAPRSQAQWVFVIESFGKVLCWPLPLRWIVTQSLEVDHDQVAFQEVVLSKFHILRRRHHHTVCRCWLDTECLLHAHSRVFKILYRAQIDSFGEKFLTSQPLEARIFLDAWCVNKIAELFA